ncbi:hypothetical protein FQA39_LY18425 [Lamprigera yunnana]|nr:hypothetical protein FQA39_LY18425 [Lamprigera yunnana]
MERRSSMMVIIQDCPPHLTGVSVKLLLLKSELYFVKIISALVHEVQELKNTVNQLQTRTLISQRGSCVPTMDTMDTENKIIHILPAKTRGEFEERERLMAFNEVFNLMPKSECAIFIDAALNNRYLEVLNDIRQYSAVAVMAGICLEPLIPLSPQNVPNSPKGVQMKRNHVPCDIFEELLHGTCLEPYTLVPYKSSTNRDNPFVDEMEITCTCDKTASSMNVCLEHYTNGSARDHQISVHNKRTNLDDLFVDEMEIVCTCAQATSSKRVCLEHYADRPAPEQQITVEIPDTPPPPIFDSRDPMSVTIARGSKLISSDKHQSKFYKFKITGIIYIKYEMVQYKSTTT